MTAGRNIAAAGDVLGANITAIGTISGRDLLASRNLNVGGNIAVNGTITAGDSISSNGTVSGAYLRPTTDATEGAYCAFNGLIAKTSSGLILSCQSGVWRGPIATLTTVAGSTCPSGLVPIMYYGSLYNKYTGRTQNHWFSVGDLIDYTYGCSNFGGDAGGTCDGRYNVNVPDRAAISMVKCG
eukprot:scaffold31.g3779.t1